MIRRAARRARASLEACGGLRGLLQPPPWEGYRATPRRLFNLYRLRCEELFGRTRLRSYPIRLTVEAMNACNLRCPACFTGAGEVGRERSAMPLSLYRRLLHELGSYLFEIELCSWGEPLLNPDVCTMIREAVEKGISTTVSTNFSFAFDAGRAEELVASGLTVLGVSIDGTTQESYEKYRVKGRLATVLENCRLVAEAKRRLGSQRPRMVWSFHVFPHNRHEVSRARSMAAEVGMDFCASRGWLLGPDWDPTSGWRVFGDPRPLACIFPWGFAVVNNDGGVAACCGAFYREDDLGRIALHPDAPGAASFMEVWNNERFRAARRFFRSSVAGPDEADLRHICFHCPKRTIYRRWKKHREAGRPAETFDPGFTGNDLHNWMWTRKPGAHGRPCSPGGQHRPEPGQPAS